MADYHDLPKTWLLWIFHYYPHIGQIINLSWRDHTYVPLPFPDKTIPPDATTQIGFRVFKNLFTPPGQMFIPPQLNHRSTWNEIERLSQIEVPDTIPPDWYTIPGEGARWFERALLTLDQDLGDQQKTMATLARARLGEHLQPRIRAISVQTSPAPVHGRKQPHEVIYVSSSDDEDQESGDDDDEESPLPRRRGRPPGAKNKNQTHYVPRPIDEDKPFAQRGRGRPLGRKNNPKASGTFDQLPFDEQMLHHYLSGNY